MKNVLYANEEMAEEDLRSKSESGGAWSTSSALEAEAREFESHLSDLIGQ